MPTLDSCVNAIFEPGNIGSSIGTTPTVIYGGSLYTPDTYDPTAVIYSYDMSRFYDFAHLLQMGLN